MISTVTSTTATVILTNSTSLTNNKILIVFLLILSLLVKEIIISIEDSEKPQQYPENLMIIKNLSHAIIIPFLYVFILIFISEALRYLS